MRPRLQTKGLIEIGETCILGTCPFRYFLAIRISSFLSRGEFDASRLLVSIKASAILPVFSVIFEYRIDGRNSSARPTVRPHSALSTFQSKPKHVHLYSVNHISCIAYNRARI